MPISIFLVWPDEKGSEIKSPWILGFRIFLNRFKFFRQIVKKLQIQIHTSLWLFFTWKNNTGKPTFDFETMFWLVCQLNSVWPPILADPGRWGTSVARMTSPEIGAGSLWRPSGPSWAFVERPTSCNGGEWVRRTCCSCCSQCSDLRVHHHLE